MIQIQHSKSQQIKDPVLPNRSKLLVNSSRVQYWPMDPGPKLTNRSCSSGSSPSQVSCAMDVMWVVTSGAGRVEEEAGGTGHVIGHVTDTLIVVGAAGRVPVKGCVRHRWAVVALHCQHTHRIILITALIT